MLLPSRLLAGAALGLAIGCSGRATATDTAADESAIRAIDARWNEYLKTQHDSAIGAIYAPDAILLPPNMPRVSGAEPIRRFWAGIWPLKASLVLAPGTIHVSGEWAIEEGNWSWRITTPQGDQKDNGKYLVAWHKTGVGWRAVQDIWNSDNPPPTTSPPAQ
jgi:ketosteroid isomerase-like protein